MNGATLYFSNGTKTHYSDASLALKVYYALPRNMRVAFRHDSDTLPVLAHDYVRA